MKPDKKLDYPIIELLKKRWSPRSFSEQDISDDEVSQLFEAARWSASAFNEQPWRFLYALKRHQPAYERLIIGLNERNRSWASSAPLVAFAIANTRFSRNDKINQHAFYDTGLAVSQLSVQATSMNLYVHQMAGIERDYLINEYGINDPYDVICGLVIGHIGNPENLPAPLAEVEKSAPQRNPIEKFAFQNTWNQ